MCSAGPHAVQPSHSVPPRAGSAWRCFAKHQQYPCCDQISTHGGEGCGVRSGCREGHEKLSDARLHPRESSYSPDVLPLAAWESAIGQPDQEPGQETQAARFGSSRLCWRAGRMRGTKSNLRSGLISIQTCTACTGGIERGRLRLQLPISVVLMMQGRWAVQLGCQTDLIHSRQRPVRHRRTCHFRFCGPSPPRLSAVCSKRVDRRET